MITNQIDDISGSLDCTMRKTAFEIAGNTKKIAEAIGEGLKDKGNKVELMSVLNAGISAIEEHTFVFCTYGIIVGGFFTDIVSLLPLL